MTVQDSQIQITVFNKTGKLILRSTMRQITRVGKRLFENDSDFKYMFDDQ